MAHGRTEGDLPLLYNGLVETATRDLLILDACYPSSLSFDDLRLLDLFVVFGEDLGFPVSLHVLLPGRTRAHEFRPRAIRQGLDLLLALGCITSFDEAGSTKFKAGDDALALDGWVSSQYLATLQETARWMNLQMDAMGDRAFLDKVQARLDELSDVGMHIPSGTEDRFSGLAAVYASDLVRLEGMEEAAWLLKYIVSRHSIETGQPVPETVPSEDWFESVRQAAAKEAKAVRQKSAGLAEVVAGLD
jgi:hypothetical protein